MEDEKHDNNSYNENSIRTYFFNGLDEPVVLKGFLFTTIKHGKWKCLTWDKSDWEKVLGNDLYKIQFGKRYLSSEVQDFPQWEHLNLKGNMSYEQMIKWDNGENFTALCNTQVNHTKYWAYLDYYYMKNLINIEQINDTVSWETLGFPEIKAKDSTLWIGTSGANTPCHIDTYGANIVCQIYGKKRWIMFPRDQSPYLYPSRVPYEESSIYSEIGFPNPNIKKFSKLKCTTPYIITLEAGDVLLVPKHWWHFVENLEFAISINTWIPMSTDNHDRLKESLVSYQVGSLCQSISETNILQCIFNPNMFHIASMSSLELFDYLKGNISLYMEKINTDQNLEERNCKRKKVDNITHTDISPLSFVKKYTFEEYWSLIKLKYSNDEQSISEIAENIECKYVKLIVQTFTDDRVINILKTVLDENLQNY